MKVNFISDLVNLSNRKTFDCLLKKLFEFLSADKKLELIEVAEGDKFNSVG